MYGRTVEKKGLSGTFEPGLYFFSNRTTYVRSGVLVLAEPGNTNKSTADVPFLEVNVTPALAN